MGITLHAPNTLALACLSAFITVYLQVSAICRSRTLQYNAAQVQVSENSIRQELNESDDERNDSFSADNDSSECEGGVEVNDVVPEL